MTFPNVDEARRTPHETIPDEVLRGVRGLVAAVLQRPVEEVGPDDSLEYGLGVDSMALIEINIALEQQFHVVMPDFTDPDCAGGTVADLALVVASRVAGAHNGRSS